MTPKEENWKLGGDSKTPLERFTEGISNLSEKVQTQYMNHFERFIGFAEISPDYLNKITRKALKENQTDPTMLKDLESKLREILSRFMLEKNYKITTMRKYETVINKFYEANGIDWTFTFKTNGEVNREDHAELFKRESAQPMTKEEFKGITEQLGNSRNLSMCYYSRDSGLRISDCIRLEMKDIEPILGDNPPKFYILPTMIPQKNERMARTKETDPLPATPIIGYESIHYLRLWVKDRERLLEKNGVKSEYVFCSQANTRGSKVGDKISIQTVTNRVGELRDRLGFRKNISFHSFRNNHTTDLQAGGCSYLFILIMQGKKGDVGSIRDYTNPDKKQLLTHYKKAYSTLTLVSEENETVKTMAETIKDQQRQIDALKQIRIGQTENGIIELGLKDQAHLETIYSALNGESEKDRELRAIKDEMAKMMKRIEELSK